MIENKRVDHRGRLKRGTEAARIVDIENVWSLDAPGFEDNITMIEHRYLFTKVGMQIVFKHTEQLKAIVCVISFGEFVKNRPRLDQLNDIAQLPNNGLYRIAAFLKLILKNELSFYEQHIFLVVNQVKNPVYANSRRKESVIEVLKTYNKLLKKIEDKKKKEGEDQEWEDHWQWLDLLVQLFLKDEKSIVLTEFMPTFDDKINKIELNGEENELSRITRSNSNKRALRVIMQTNTEPLRENFKVGLDEAEFQKVQNYLKDWPLTQSIQPTVDDLLSQYEAKLWREGICAFLGICLSCFGRIYQIEKKKKCDHCLMQLFSLFIFSTLLGLYTLLWWYIRSNSSILIATVSKQLQNQQPSYRNGNNGSHFIYELLYINRDKWDRSDLVLSILFRYLKP